MRCKRISAWICSAVLLFSSVPVLQLSAANTAAVLYVSDSGADTADGQTPETPLQSVGKAIELLDKTQSSERTVRVIGTATVSAHLPTHTQAVRIEGNDAAAKLVLTRDIRINGPLSLDSLRLSTGGNPLLCDRNALHIGAGVTVEGTAPGIVSGYQGTWKADLNNHAQKEQVTVDGGSFDIVYLGARATQTSIPYAVVNGVDFTLNGGQVQQAVVGADGWSGNAGYNVYTGDVNITVNGGTISRVRVVDRNGISDSVRSQLNGHAVQLILNNGSSVATNELNAAAVETLGGVFYQLECAALESSRLETTDTAGTYRVIGDKAAVAKDGSHVYTSEGGLLTVPAGSYTVSWSSGETSKQETVYVSATGADTADGKTPETAVATMDKAFSLLGAQQAETKTVKIIGSYTLSAHLPTHTEPTIIKGYDENAVLTLKRFIRINGPTVFDRIRFDAGGYMLCCDRNELTMGEQVTMTSTDITQGLYVDSGYYNAYDASCNRNPQKERITIHNGLYYAVRLGTEYAVTPSVEVNGVDFTLNGGSLYKLYIGAYGDSGRKGYCNYTDNVNITLNGGSIKDRLAVSDIDGQSKLNGHAVQLILNNGMTVAKNELSAATVGALGGVYYELRCAKAADSALTATDTAGVYQVSGDKIAVATDGTTVYTSENGILTIGKPGVYAVSFVSTGLCCYVSAAGDDNAAGTKDAPLRTLSAALVKTLDGGRIIILDKAAYTADTLSSYVGSRTIEGETAAAVLAYGGGDMRLKGNLILRNLVLHQDAANASIVTNGYDLEIGESVTYSYAGTTGYTTPRIITGKAAGGQEWITIAAADFKNITVGGSGGVPTVTRIQTGNHPLSEVTVHTDSKESAVKLYTGGSIPAVNVADGAQYGSAELIANASAAAVYPTGQQNLWLINSRGLNGETVAFTDQPGTYGVRSTPAALPTAISANGSTAYVAQAHASVPETPITDYAYTAYADYIRYRKPLTHTYKRLTEDKELNVVYFGGSVTAGYGASQPDRTSWRAQVGAWLETNYPEATVHNINRAVGESGTYLGSFRVQRDVIAHKPDLVFIEYSINDSYFGSTYAQAASQFETVVREIKQALPLCDIVTVFVTDRNNAADAVQGKLHLQAQAHEAIAEKYNISSIAVGCALMSRLPANYSSVWSQYFLDGVHPTDKGYREYYLCVEEYLKNVLQHTEYRQAVERYDDLPPVQSAALFDGNRQLTQPTEALLAQSETRGGSGFRFDSGLYGLYDYNGFIKASAAGAVFAYTFDGTELSIITNQYGPDAKFQISIDGGAYVTKEFNHHNPTVLVSGLTPGRHTVLFKPDFSTFSGEIRIGAFMQRDETLSTLQGAEYRYSDWGNSTLTLPAGAYTVLYPEQPTVAALPVTQQDGYRFDGWSDSEGHMLSAETALSPGMVLTAQYTRLADGDVNGDGRLDDADLTEMQRVLLGISAVSFFDANADGVCDIRDLVALRRQLDATTPVDNAAVLYNGQHSSYDETAEQRRQAILARPDTMQPSEAGKTYYISDTGDDRNSGLSADNPWRSSARLGLAAHTLNEGDVVLFERGGVYRGAFALTSGVTYGAYGEGRKPEIYGSLRNCAYGQLWSATETPCVWALPVGNLPDIGNIVLDNGKRCGTKRLSGQLSSELEFYHDRAAGVLYLYCAEGNPGEVCFRMELCADAPLMAGRNRPHDITVENLCLKYTGSHALVFSNGSRNITVRGCEIGYIGGSMLNETVRYGNGIEFVDNADTITVTGNWIYQCYDAGITHQSSYADGCKQNAIRFCDNLVEYCVYNIEYYVSQENGRITDTVYQNNILRFAGYGFGSENRIGSNTRYAANICNYARQMPSSDFSVIGNVLDSPRYNQLTVGCPNLSGVGPTVTGNSYIQKNAEVALILGEDGSKTSLTADSAEMLWKAIAMVDAQPTAVVYEP